ncbi:hypothetical protein MMB232_00716 [Brevundimonas subvibrioides]|uniref:hypothetical protein n=1 Tax=Brevundimonas subvibrioides TaxID=74313 RepID=UPI0032D5835C
MATSADSLNLSQNDLAFVFDSEVGVDASDLGLFLQRASVVSRRAGAELYVIGLQEGSLAVVARVVRKGVKAAGEEFKSSPIRTAASGLTLVTAVGVALGLAMTPKAGQVTPLAKAGAALVHEHSVKQISLISIHRTTVIMDQHQAEEVRRLQSEPSHDSQAGQDVRRLIASARSGELSGTVLDVRGELHFRPDGFRYLVPVDRIPQGLAQIIRPNAHITVWGEVLLRDRLPDLLIIRDASDASARRR